MPYIAPNQRPRVDADIDALVKALNGFPRESLDGAVNYVLTRIVSGTFLQSQDPHHVVGYRDHAGALIALEAAKLELYRTRVAPYEDAKRSLNGDVR